MVGHAGGIGVHRALERASQLQDPRVQFGKAHVHRRPKAVPVNLRATDVPGESSVAVVADHSRAAAQISTSQDGNRVQAKKHQRQAA